ncbi:MAG: VOC family protein [Solirubrobacterales bacterium]
MSERNGFENGVPCWVDTWQPDADAAVTFYSRLFGWEAEDTMPPGIAGKHYVCSLRGRDVAAIASRPEGAPPVTAWTTYIWVANASEAVAKVIDAGGRVVKEPFDSLDGGRIAIVADPSGAAFGVWQPGRHKGAQVVNEPGAWSMSLLNTRDPEGSAAFYRAVFGWEQEGMEPADSGVRLMRLPGFEGGEPEQPVPRDVVAVMAPMSGGQYPEDAPSHWGVDFWVDDADATAEKAAAQGGTVIAPPYDVPGVGMRQAALADPQGAGFSITRAPGPPRP